MSSWNGSRRSSTRTGQRSRTSPGFTKQQLIRAAARFQQGFELDELPRPDGVNRHAVAGACTRALRTGELVSFRAGRYKLYILREHLPALVAKLAARMGHKVRVHEAGPDELILIRVRNGEAEGSAHPSP
mgnify:CR=1 FL=1